jgi:subfamily B ATP-binding cassette protein MsbA
MSYKEFIKLLFKYISQHIGKLIFTSLLMILATALESSIPEITGQIVDKLFNAERSSSTTVLYSLIIFGVISLSAIFSLLSSSTSSWVANKVVMDIRVDMFKKLLKLPKKFFDRTSSGKILSKLTFDVEQIAGAASTIWLDFIKASVTVFILVIYLFYKNWQLSLSLIVILPIVFIAVKKSSSRMRNSSSEVQKSIGNMTHLLEENISGNSVIKIFEAEKYEKDKFDHQVNNVRQQRFKVDLTAAINSNLINILLGLSLAMVVYFSSFSLQMTAGEFLSYFTALAMLIKPAKTLVNINKPFQVALAAGQSVFTFLNEEEESNNGKKSVKKLNGDINFENILFSYEPNKLVLNNFSLSVKAGETIAIVGPTGSGKTTIIDLLTKFYTPQSGSIFIDGIDIKKLNNHSLRSNIAFVDQGTRLFNDTIRANIALGKLNEMSLETVKESAVKAEAIEFIDNLEKQFDTDIGDNGQLLSGGQRQRLAIARAIAKDASILILDEATSALDSSTEKLVQKSIAKMTQHRTTIVIAHRLSTIQNADRIIVLKSGEIIEEGTHENLIKNNGYYSQLVKDQYK